MVIPRRRFAENEKEMYRNRKKHVQIFCFLVIKYAKFVALSLPSRRRSLTPCSQNADAL